MSLELHKTITLHRYQLTTKDLKVQEDAPAWLALIEALHEVSEDYGGRFKERQALAYWGEKILPSFNDPMRKRLFHRMKAWGFIEQVDGEYYALTDLARRARADKAFWRSEAGVYEVWLWEEGKELRQQLGLLPDPILVLIRPDSHQGSREQDYSDRRSLADFANKEGYYLASYEASETSTSVKAILKEATNPIHFLSKESARLIIHEEVPHAVYIELQLTKGQGVRLEFRLPPESETLWYSSYKLSQLILGETFREAYDAKQNALLVPFSERDLALEAKHRVEKPRFRDIEFENAIELSVKRLPRTEEDAQQWVVALLSQRLGKYLHSEEELHQEARAIAQPIYERYSKLSPPSRSAIAKSWFEKGLYRKAYYLQAALDLCL